MTRSAHRFHLEFLTPQGQTLGQLPLTPDWEPALESLKLAARRRGLVVNGHHATEIEPVHSEQVAAPLCAGFRGTLRLPGGATVVEDFTFTYFRREARAGSGELVSSGKLKEGEQYLYRLVAFADTVPAVVRTNGRFAVEVDEAPVDVRETRLSDWLARALPCGPALATDFPVFIPQSVLAESATLAEAAGAKETGGVLIGHLHQDHAARELFVEVTALVPARHTEAELTKLTFTDATWTDSRNAVALRRAGEQFVGWQHSHPGKFFCNPACPPERRKTCPLMRDFFSDEDVTFHRTVFPRASSIALVTTITDEGLQHALFGWRGGVIHQRGFHVVGAQQPVAVEATINPEKDHASPCPTKSP